MYKQTRPLRKDPMPSQGTELLNPWPCSSQMKIPCHPIYCFFLVLLVPLCSVLLRARDNPAIFPYNVTNWICLYVVLVFLFFIFVLFIDLFIGQFCILGCTQKTGKSIWVYLIFGPKFLDNLMGKNRNLTSNRESAFPKMKSTEPSM